MTTQTAAITRGTMTPEQWRLIEQRLYHAFLRRVLNFHIQVLDDGLVLEGRTLTYFGKQAVQHAVMEATGLPIVANNIEVG